MSAKKLSKKAIILTLVIVTLVILVYSIVTVSYHVILQANPLAIAIALSAYFLSWLVSAIRLMVLHRILDGSNSLLSIRDYFYARLLGGLVAYLTPSAIGGEPVRAYYISVKAGQRFSRYFALALYEVFYDVIVVGVIALVLAIYIFPLSLPVVLVSASNIVFWIVLYYLLNSIISPERANPFVKRLLLFVRSNIVNKMSRLSNGYTGLGEAFSEISRKVRTRYKILLVLLTLLIHLIAAQVIFLLELLHEGSKSIWGLQLSAVLAYFYSLSMGALPTPGGTGAIEYGLSIVLDPTTVVLSRIVMYYSVIVAGLIALVKSSLVREVIG